MKTIRGIICLIAILCILIRVVEATDAESSAIAIVRAALTTVVDSLPPRRSGASDYMREFGFRNRGTSAYRNLAEVASNNYEIVISNIHQCATNDLERMVLMSAGWGYDDDYFLRWYSDLVDLAMAGVVSQDEVRWYSEGSGNEWRMNLLAIRYDAPGVSNLVLKLQGLSGRTNYYQKVLNGESKRSYLQYKAEVECGLSD